MKALIMVHSKTGTTLGFARKVEEAFLLKGYEVKVLVLETDKPDYLRSIREPLDFTITNLPDIAEYDVLLPGGPIWAFGLSPILYKALLNLADLQGKRVIPFITMGFPFAGLGGRGALSLITKTCTSRGANVTNGVVLCRMFHDWQKEMQQGVREIMRQVI